MYDVRAVANFVLDVAEIDGRDVSNLHINKIVYFLHTDFLVAFSRPLVSAKIEAWTYGPVFRELYREFKQFGDAPIVGRARYLDPDTGQKRRAEWHFTREEEEFLREHARKYASMSPSALVAQSHVEGGPWDQTWNHETKTNASMKISDEAIKSWYERTVKH
ncbi:UNVERIFIED_ORG: DUF4065 domain-containing protein [Roseateles sp. XES5]|nr:type II toxin-antitoxin system antitoxin SocA domain-containing protein [Roseateles sp. XES5]